METVVSGIRPTGNLHLGNYFGAVKGFLQMMNEYNCYFFIADWHSLTTHPHPENIRNSVRTILAEYLACGLDPEKATIYVQSDVREVAELYLYLNMNAGIGELMRTTSFKDKARQQLHIDRVNTVEGDVEREIFNEGNKNSVSAGQGAGGQGPGAEHGDGSSLCPSFQLHLWGRFLPGTCFVLLFAQGHQGAWSGWIRQDGQE